MTEPLHLKYRPSDWESFGNPKIFNSLSKIIDKREAQSFLITGPSGVGKTTLARIIAKELGCSNRGITEINAANNTGIDDMRSIVEQLNYKTFGGNDLKVIIVDEAHRLSSAAWASLLKPIEEPPAHVFWIFCTTDESRVPNTIKTRCIHYKIPEWKTDDIITLLENIIQKENIVFKETDKALRIIAKAANGSPRQALIDLNKSKDAKNIEDIISLLNTADDDNVEIIDICRLLIKPQGIKWNDISSKIAKLGKTTDPESIRLVILRYFSTVATAEKTREPLVLRSLRVLNAFSEPCRPSEGMAPILMSLGEIIYDE